VNTIKMYIKNCLTEAEQLDNNDMPIFSTPNS